MPHLTWKQSYQTGIAILDEQHRGLFAALGRLHAAKRAGAIEEETGDLMAFLKDYTGTHFKTEEDLMLAHGYVGYQEHKVHHDWFVAEVAALESRLRSGKAEATAVVELIGNWIHHHILEVDSRYVSCLSKVS
jgi:hemerythrin